MVSPDMDDAAAPYTSSKKIKRATSAATNGVKKKGSVSKKHGTISIDNLGHGQAARSPKAREPVQPAALPPALQDQRNLEEQLVELDHLRTLNIEVGRERGVTESVQSDVGMLRNQLGRANDSI